MNYISFKELKSLLEKKQINIIDLRSEKDFKKNHLHSSKNISHVKLMKNPERYLNLYDLYYLLCDTGFISNKTTIFLKNKGYSIINVFDGYKND